jgi:hypothetical protein
MKQCSDQFPQLGIPFWYYFVLAISQLGGFLGALIMGLVTFRYLQIESWLNNSQIGCRSLLEKELDGPRSGGFHRRFRLPDRFNELCHVGCGTLDQCYRRWDAFSHFTHLYFGDQSTGNQRGFIDIQ